MTDIDAIRARHADCTPHGRGLSHRDPATGCDTAVVLAALDERPSYLREHDLIHRWSVAEQERDAARADADRLAKALGTMLTYSENDLMATLEADTEARAALAAHREATK